MKPWFSDTEKEWKCSFGKYEVYYSRRSRNGIMGRFGGGWNWKLGFQASGKTLLLSLLVSELTITRK